MLFESEKRAAALAVSRYGADGASVQLAADTVRAARARGDTLDLFDLLLEQNVLAPAQVHELRVGLDATQPDLSAPNVPPPVDVNGNIFLEGDGMRRLGAFRILRPLGEGGMSNVYLGYHEIEHRQVAIKVLPDHLASSQVSIDRFYREAKSGALLNHPNIVRNITVGQDQATGKHYLVLEYVDGPSAQTLLDQMGKLPVGDAVHIILDIGKALEHAHSRNIVHRDIKPGNILITQSGVAKLADLGLAKRTDETSHLTAARQGFGTPYYMPYEQAMNARVADIRSDIYALGATLYHLLTGEVPFPGNSHIEIVDKKSLGFFEPASTHNPAVPEVLDGILARMMAREPRDRYQTASELIVDLDRSNLAALVPSFIDSERALRDPLVRARLAAPAQATCPDLSLQPAAEELKTAVASEFWFLRYRDRHGRWCKAKASVHQILERVREGRLADAEASQQPQGPYVPLGELEPFRNAVAGRPVKKAAKKKRRERALEAPIRVGGGLADSAVLAAPSRGWLILCLSLSAAVLATITLVVLFFRPT